MTLSAINRLDHFWVSSITINEWFNCVISNMIYCVNSVPCDNGWMPAFRCLAKINGVFLAIKIVFKGVSTFVFTFDVYKQFTQLNPWRSLMGAHIQLCEINVL
jgi:hypothetical protein